MHMGTIQSQPSHRPPPLVTGFALVGMAVAAVAATLLVIAHLGIFAGLGRGATTAGPNAIVLSAQQMRFGQEEIHLQVGQTVTFVLDNRDLYPHSFDADGLELHVPMPSKGTATATFTATRPGVFDFYCAVPGHTAAGMAGKIIVEPS